VSERRLYGLRAGALLVLLAAPFATAQDAYPADITLASSRLIAAWGRMQARYPGWPSETRESIYHHLCALDLF
jgi:hypothetical protein